MTTMQRFSGWGLYTVILDKSKLQVNQRHDVSSAELYTKLCTHLLNQIQELNEISEINVFIDRCMRGKEEKILNKSIENMLREKMPIGAIMRLTQAKSHEVEGIQAADIFSWSIHRKYERKDKVQYNHFALNVKKEVFFI